MFRSRRERKRYLGEVADECFLFLLDGVELPLQNSYELEAQAERNQFGLGHERDWLSHREEQLRLLWT